MPYQSRAQAAYFNIHKKELGKKGVDVGEWNAASKGKDLPEHVHHESHEHSNTSYSIARSERKKSASKI